jgi:hypothetical protein
MTESTERLAVDEDLRYNVDGLVASQTEELGDDGGRGEFDKDNMVQSDAVERVLESHAALDFVCFDHGFEDVFDLERLAFAGEVVRDGEDRSEVVGGVTPFGSEPA